MKQGEKSILVCQPENAYGKKGSPPKIPENAQLVFEVELFKWDMEDLSPDNDKGILRSVITEGKGYATPGDGSNVEVHPIGRCQSKRFEEKDVKFELGIGCEVGIVKGLEIGLKKFQKGEKSNVILSPKYAFGSEGNSELNLPPNATIEYEVALKSFEKEKETWNMTIEEKIKQSEIMKTKGTNYFKNGKFEMALKMYQRIINYFQQESESAGENKRVNALLVAGYLNLAACYLKLEEYEEVILNCDKALEIEPKIQKAFSGKDGVSKLLQNACGRLGHIMTTINSLLKTETSRQLFHFLTLKCTDLRQAVKCHMACTGESTFFNSTLLTLLKKANGGVIDTNVYHEFSRLATTNGTVESADVPPAMEKLSAYISKDINPEQFKKMDINQAVNYLEMSDTVSGHKYKKFLVKHGRMCLKVIIQ